MDTRKFLEGCIKELTEVGGSDLHIKEGRPPRIRAKGLVQKTKQPEVDKETMQGFVDILLNDYQKKLLEKNGGVDFAFTLKNYGRYRGNLFYQMGNLSFVIRVIRMEIPSFEELDLPRTFEKIVAQQRGLILVSGATSAGKSTTVSAMVNYINQTRECHIITIEDPIEFVHNDQKAIINQREIGADVATFSDGLKYVMRQDPDVIVIGEMRDSESFKSAVAASETGHLVISTVHAKNVMQCFDRILGFFPSEMHEQVLVQLSFNMRSITCQRLIPRKDGTGMIPAIEILRSTPTVDKLIRENQMEKMGQAIQSGKEDGMQTFNQALLDLYRSGDVTREDALLFSDNPQALEMNFQGIFLDERTGGILGESD